MRHATLGVAALVTLALVSGCTSTDKPDPGPAAPPLAQVTSAAAVPASTRTPGPPVTNACALLTNADVQKALGMKVLGSKDAKMAEKAHSCTFSFDKHNLTLYAGTEPTAGTAEAAANRTIHRYEGTLEPVPGLGDAALYVADPSWQTLVAVRIEGSQQRIYTLIAFLGKPAKEPLISLMRKALERP